MRWNFSPVSDQPFTIKVELNNSYYAISLLLTHPKSQPLFFQPKLFARLSQITNLMFFKTVILKCVYKIYLVDFL